MTCSDCSGALVDHPMARLVGGFADGELVVLHRVPGGSWPDRIELPVKVREVPDAPPSQQSEWVIQGYDRDRGEDGFVYKFRPA